MPTFDRVIKPAQNLLGSMRLPGDKSISHRYAMLAGLADGTSTFDNFSTGADCQSTLDCMKALGCEVTREGTKVTVKSTGQLRAPSAPLDCGNSGSTMRMLAGILVAQSFESEMTGDESLSRRPMARIIDPLKKMGARISASAGDKAPLRIVPSGGLKGIEYSAPNASAQVKSCVLFAGLNASGTTVFEEPIRTRDHGELALRAFGAQLQRSKNRITIEGGQKLTPIEAVVPGDISSAAFFLCAAALFPDSNLIIDGVGLNPTRASLLDVLSGFGARVSVMEVEEHNQELIGRIKVEHGTLRGGKISGVQSAQLIDELPVLAAIAPYTQDGVEIRDAKELRVKESDRIATVAKNLRAMGADVTEFEDGLRVAGNTQLHGAEIDTAGDHRIAMAFATAALRAAGETLIRDAECASISFPEFWERLDALSEC